MATQTKIALITGASRRLGRSVAEALHDRGWNLALHCHRSTEALAQLMLAFNGQREGSAHGFQADLAKTSDVRRMIKALSEHYPAFDLIINNAAVFPETGLEDISPELFDNTMAINLKAPLMLCQGLLPQLNTGASIINFCDIFGQIPLARHVVYSASKAALIMATKSLAMDLAPRIRVNGVAPGAILSPADTHDDAMLTSLLTKTPLGRLGGEAAIVQAVEYLIDNPYVTGQILPIDGGLSVS